MAQVVAIAPLDLRGCRRPHRHLPFVREVLLSIRGGVEHHDA